MQVDAGTQPAADQRRRAGRPGRPGDRDRPSVKAAAQTRPQDRRHARRSERAALAMKLKLVRTGGAAKGVRIEVSDATFGREFNEAAGPPGRDRLHGGGPRGHQGAEDQGRSARRRQEALEPEGHGPGACRLDPQPDLGRRRSRLRGAARATSRRRSTARCTAARSARCSPSSPVRIAWWWSTASSSRRRRPGCWSAKLDELGLDDVLILVEAYDEKLRPRRRATCRTSTCCRCGARPAQPRASPRRCSRRSAPCSMLEEKLA